MELVRASFPPRHRSHAATGPTAASFSRCLTTVAETKKAAAISSSFRPLFCAHRLGRPRKLSSGCSGARLDVLGQAVFLARPSVRTMQGNQRKSCSYAFCLTSSSRRPETAPAGGEIVYIPVSRNAVVQQGPHGDGAEQAAAGRCPRPVPRSDPPALDVAHVRLAELRLLKGMSREALQGDFLLRGSQDNLRDGPAGSLSPDLQTRHRKPATSLNSHRSLLAICKHILF